MRYILIFCLALLMNVHADAQVMQGKSEWATIIIPQIKCWVCKEKLEQYLLKEKGPNSDAGIIKWTINVNAGSMRIQYVPDRMPLDYIRTAINNAGFDADSTRAEPDSYKMLPPICKRADEGGGPQKGKPCNMPPNP